MPAATTVQLKRLDDFIAGASDPWQRSGNQAVLYVHLSPQAGAWLFLRPAGEKSGKEVWAGELVREWAAEPEARADGSYDDCLYWLRRRRNELTARRDAISAIREFADSRKGWKFHDREAYDAKDGKSYAGRVFEYSTRAQSVHPQILLSVQPDVPELRSSALSAAVNAQSSAGPEASVSGTLDDISQWVADWEKTLEVPLKLAECQRLPSARSLVEELGNKCLSQLSYLFDIDGNASRTRVELIKMFVPVAVQKRYPS